MSKVTYHFGQFTVQAEPRQLLCNGVAQMIQEQPMQVLLALLEQPGQVVTRETLRLRLWGTNTYVDFDQSLNSAVRRLRHVLGDDSRRPVFIETLPRTGFRFLPALTVEDPTGQTLVKPPAGGAAHRKDQGERSPFAGVRADA